MTTRAREYTPVEAAVVCEVPVKSVYTAIDKKIILGRRAGNRGRVFSELDLLRLVIWCCVGLLLSADRRKGLLDALAATPDAHSLQASDFLTVNVAVARDRLAARSKALLEAERAIRCRKGLSGGEPVFIGSHVAVRSVAAEKARGASTEEIIQSYPSFTPRMVELAEIWSAAHPPRGRPRKSSRPVSGEERRGRI